MHACIEVDIPTFIPRCFLLRIMRGARVSLALKWVPCFLLRIEEVLTPFEIMFELPAYRLLDNSSSLGDGLLPIVMAAKVTYVGTRMWVRCLTYVCGDQESN